MAAEAYCVKCRAKREIKDPQEVTMKNGRPAMKGVCPVCGTAIFRIGSGSSSSASTASTASSSSDGAGTSSKPAKSGSRAKK
jgi:hypothetical protein